MQKAHNVVCSLTASWWLPCLLWWLHKCFNCYCGNQCHDAGCWAGANSDGKFTQISDLCRNVCELSLSSSRLLLLLFLSQSLILSLSLSVCLLNESKTTNLSIPDFSLLPVLLYPSGSGLSLALCLSFFFFFFLSILCVPTSHEEPDMSSSCTRIIPDYMEIFTVCKCVSVFVYVKPLSWPFTLHVCFE